MSHQGWSRQKWLRTLLYVLAIVLAAAAAVTDGQVWRQGAAIFIAAIACVAVLVRVKSPYLLPITAMVMAAVSGPLLLGPSMFNLGLRRRNYLSLGVLAASLVVLAFLPSSRGSWALSVGAGNSEIVNRPVQWALNSAFLVVVPALLGAAFGVRRELLASYRDRAVRAETERTLLARQAVLLDRARIARDSHDVLGHKLSLLAMQAGGLELNADVGSLEVERQAKLMRNTASEAVKDLRSIIDAQAGQDELPSMAGDDIDVGLAKVLELVAQSRSSGAVVDLQMNESADWAKTPYGLAHTAYRIVQECLTNAYRHAPGSAVHVSIEGGPGLGLTIAVRNRLTRKAKTTANGPAGTGLLGLQARARRMGGSVVSEQSASSFTVRARLPWVPQAHGDAGIQEAVLPIDTPRSSSLKGHS